MNKVKAILPALILMTAVSAFIVALFSETGRGLLIAVLGVACFVFYFWGTVTMPVQPSSTKPDADRPSPWTQKKNKDKVE